MMPRRRSRVTLIIAVVLVFILYQAFLSSDWDPTANTLAPKPNVPLDPAHDPAPQDPKQQDIIRKPAQDPVQDPALEPVQDEGVTLPDREGSPPMHNPAEPVDDVQTPEPPPVERPGQLPDLRDEDDHKQKPNDFSIPTKPKPEGDIKGGDMLVAVSTLSTQPEPPKPTPKPANVKGLEDEEIHPKNPPGRQPDDKADGAPPKKNPLHWEKQTEHFPVPTESIIPLPKGSPKPFPKIQYDFKSESPAGKEVRLKRLEQVKSEAERAWGGYRKYAWTHDELAPQSLTYRDPFCGWAATLVDSLDTLWIMGLKDEFDEAAKAVKDIDFTYSSKRNDIPVFETIIRYLGGLLAAYDVSGGKDGKYQVLLDKALELAEILMGIFDTPNRMPILYYNSMPEYASQPHRASTGSIAEVATMSMEFTRLAQLTGEERYYDAIARITLALKDLQDRGTSVPGIFPESLDLSGCNKTATRERDLSMEAQKKTDDEAKPEEPQGHEDVPIGDFRSPAKPDEEEGLPRGKEFEPAKGPESISRRAVMVGKDGKVATHISDEDRIPQMGKLEFPELPSFRHDSLPFSSDGQHAEFDCVPQGIEPASSGYQQFSMGGSQDSAYEYFQKEDLLLGGLESVYKTLHVGTVEAVKKWLLFRPMVPNDRDILFSAKIVSSGDPVNDARYEYEVTHLACFLGGMFGMGSKIYERPEDLEIAKKLTDGCVWAYESTASGIMPEYSIVVPCAEKTSCPYNETLWWEYLDPSAVWRAKNVKDWEDRQVKKQKAREAALKPRGAPLTDDPEGTHPLGKRMPAPASANDKPIQKRDEQAVSGGVLSQVPIKELDRPDPKPLSHEEFVQGRIDNEGIPPGFVAINERKYILRPEAIESVWYMYRITGDPIWQEKGWRMFEAIIKATQTEAGHSAIESVLDKQPSRNDAMESFWLAETLKYFYLLFAEPDVISLDEWVLNTEAHPFKRPA